MICGRKGWGGQQSELPSRGQRDVESVTELTMESLTEEIGFRISDSPTLRIIEVKSNLSKFMGSLRQRQMPSQQKPDCVGPTPPSFVLYWWWDQQHMPESSCRMGIKTTCSVGLLWGLGKLSTVIFPIPSKSSIMRGTMVSRPGSFPRYVPPIWSTGPWKNAEWKRGRKKQEIPSAQGNKHRPVLEKETFPKS